jgi:Sulfotransferase domain
MDVLCVGMYRACSTWQYEVAAHLVETHREGQRLGFVTGEEYAGRGPAGDDEWRVLKSHEGHRDFAEALASRRAVAIYAFRDLRDTVFSLMYKRALSFEALLRHGMIHQVRDNDRFWSRQPNLLVQRYEDLVANPARGVEELARHLGISLDRGEASVIAAEYSFEKNRRRARDLQRQLRETGCNPTDPSCRLVYDDKTLLHWNHLRDGRVGGWRERATSRQRATLGRLMGDWLIERGYEPDRSWAGDPRRGNPMERVRINSAIARGGFASRLRGLSLRYPTLSGIVKRGLRLHDAYTARPFVPAARLEAQLAETGSWTVHRPKPFDGPAGVAA